MDTYLIGLWSIFINILIKSFCSAVHSLILTSVDINESIKTIIYLLISILSAFFISWILNTTFVRNILSKIGKKTPGNDIFKDVIDYNKRTMMQVYLKDSDNVYLGAFKLKDENGPDSYITLIEYSIYQKGTNTPIRDNSKTLGLPSAVTFSLHDVECIEIIYENDSTVWKWLNNDNSSIPEAKKETESK